MDYFLKTPSFFHFIGVESCLREADGGHAGAFCCDELASAYLSKCISSFPRAGIGGLYTMWLVKRCSK